MDYFLRTTQSDWPELLSLGVTLGILRVSESGEHCGDGWDYIGPVYRETGQSVTVDGIETALTAPVLAPDGRPYVHANLRLSFDLRERVEEMVTMFDKRAADELAMADLPPYEDDETGELVDTREYYLSCAASAQRQADGWRQKLADLSRFFVTDENGAPKRPDMPARVFF